MTHRRGTKRNPFEVGEKVRLSSLNREGVVTKVIQPMSRGWISYDVEFMFHGTTVIERFSVVSLCAVEDGNGEK